MARQLFTGLNAGVVQIDRLGTLPAQASYDTTVYRTGGRSLKYVAASGVSSAAAISAASGNFVRFYLRVTARPSTTARVIFGASGNALQIRLNPNGTLAIYFAAALVGTSTTALTDTSRWYRVEARALSGTSVVLLRIDGVDEVTGTISSTSWTYQFGASDTVADTYTINVADVTSDTTTFPGEGSVQLLVPNGDSARAAKWTAGTSGTTNLWDAVDNLPPTGKVSPQTTTSAITHAGSGAGNEDYDASLPSYSSLAAASVTAVQMLAYHGEDISTGTKTLQFAIKSNPAGAFSTAESAGGDVGAVGAWPTNWTLSAITIIESPSVVLGTSPVISVRRNSTESRLADVCFMGMWVEYIPPAAAVDRPPTQLVMAQQVAVNRAASY